MEIIELSNYKETRFNTGIALGNFDGIHLGHQKLIKSMVEKSRLNKLKPALLLFKKHTKFLIKSKEPKIITNIEQKIEILKKLGVEVVYLIDFDEKLMKLSGEEFVKKIIIEKMNTKFIMIGFDYRFGYKASGNSKDLIELGKKHSICVDILNPISYSQEVISSSNIRRLINSGEMEKVTELLGREYSVIGKVISGDKRGTDFGFPTANIKLINNYTIPKNGVYMTKTLVNNKTYNSATNIGYNPTFGNENLKLETHILNFKDDIYGKTIEVKFVSFIREDIKFDNVNDLIDQMKSDVKWIKNQL